ncbi:N-6 DNA methylase [Spirulina major CS-329]|uniref:Eco57I restriction-modification methylase domain-containing protein n=1 Tax=Spirulina TaxID=1154 RepID=UPI0023310408|nr:DNA methyltransferase [Spirulina major]MDB9504715.1 N-6 DNA methylase [Spirulina major CS-329]
MNDRAELYHHQEWLGLVQPVGLVVAPIALIRAQAYIDRAALLSLQNQFNAVIEDGVITDFWALVVQVLQWPEKRIVRELPPDLTVVLPSYQETLQATAGLRDRADENWLLLIQLQPPETDLDALMDGAGWRTTPQAKFERLLRETQVPIGLLSNGTHLRLVYAPLGESSGYITFPVQAMTEVAGRLILGALVMLLGKSRLFTAPPEGRLPKILDDSRKAQAEVSTQLAAQVLDALWELLRGFQTADADANGRLLQGLTEDAEGRQHIYGGLITTLMRLVFLLYAEDEGLMPDDEIYQRNYAVSGLYEKLREDVGSYPDTLDQRYGAWATLLSLFRLVYDGGGAYAAYLPARHGQLFDPDEYAFLEGRPHGTEFQTYGRVDAPRIPDGTIYRMLDKLLMLNGDRLSYRALDVEQIGSVYEAIMGYEVEVAEGRSIAVKPKDVVINGSALLATPGKDRVKVLQDWAECKLTGKGATALKGAKTLEEIVAALGSRVSSRTLNLLPPGSLYLQPGEERRRTGSHYTPRKLTQPIVETTLRPVLAQLGDNPTPDQILALKVCDLAMGSAAFLVEVCRQLAARLVEAWDSHGQPADLPDAVEPLLYARRLVAQRCLYGVDKNPFAVNLAKLSLWLVTLAKDQPFTFVDHALKCGDSLVGLTRSEIGAFTGQAQLSVFGGKVRDRISAVQSKRLAIQMADSVDDAADDRKRQELRDVDEILSNIRLAADLSVAAFFDGTKAKERQSLAEDYKTLLAQGTDVELRAISEGLRHREPSVTPFNWDIEFPEVFERPNPGFDAIVGNPPFAGKNTIAQGHAAGYLDWLKVVHPESHGNADLVAHFFRRGLTITRQGGAYGLIATNTIAQGDTRSTGLRYICNHGGLIYNARKRVKWPGLAAVVVSVVHIFKQ